MSVLRWRMGLIWISMAALPALAAPLTLCYEDAEFMPWSRPDGSGLNLDLIRTVGNELHEDFVFKPKPWKRCLEEARSGVVDGVVAVAIGPDRVQYGAFPMQGDGQPRRNAALYTEPAWLFVRKASSASWDGAILNNPRQVVIAQAGFLVADLLRQRGYRVVENIKSVEDGMRALVAGVADVAVLQGHLAQDMALRDSRFAGRVVQMAEPFAMLDYYLMFSKSTYSTNPKRFQAIWDSVARVRQSPEYRHAEEAALSKMQP